LKSGLIVEAQTAEARALSRVGRPLLSNIVSNTAAGAVLGGSLLFTAGLGLAGAVGTPNSPTNPTNPTNPMSPSEQQPG
jgi:hypothetical protein